MNKTVNCVEILLVITFNSVVSTNFVARQEEFGFFYFTRYSYNPLRATRK